jgi:hypothetical protein
MSATQRIIESPSLGSLPREDPLRWLAYGAIVGPVLFTMSWLVLGFVSTGYAMWDIRIDHYSAITQPISGLGLGSTGPVMNAVFVLTGICLIAGAVGVFQSVPQLSTRTRRLLTGLLALHGLGAILSGIFTLEAFMLHSLGFALALSPIITFPIIGRSLRRAPGWEHFARRMRWASPMTLILAVLYFATFNPEAAGDGAGIAGITQRLLIVELQAWILAMGWMSLRVTRSGAGVALSARTGGSPSA